MFLLLISSLFCRAQAGSGKTLVFKVRAPKAACSIFTEENFFWQEKNNVIRIKTRGTTGRIQVELTGGKITAQNGDQYTLFFTKKNDAVITVYKSGKYGREILLTKKYEVRGPTLWFCGIKTDSTSRVLKLLGPNLYAWSDYYQQILPVRSFEMLFAEDTTGKLKSKDPELFTSDTCMLTPDMRYKVLHYQPKHNYIYFHHIVCEVPDGSKCLLDPIRLHAEVDTVNVKTLNLTYAVYTMEK
jgi:hypothetical protein